MVGRLAGSVDAHRLTALCAPAGYGKSTLLADYVRQSSRQCVWLRLEDTDRDPVQLLSALSEAVDAAGASHGGARESARYAEWWPGREHVSAVDLANRIAGRRTHTLVVLDDLHAIAGSPGAVRTVRQLVRLTPEHVRLVVSSRHAVPTALGQLVPLSGIAPLDARALRFTRDEIEELLDELGVPVNDWPAALEELAVCEGWPAAVTLAVRARLLGGERALVGRSPGSWSGDSGEMFAALASSFMDGLDEEDRRLLHEAAHMERFTPELCSACLGLSDAGGRLERIAALNLFLDHRPGDDVYRMHALFRHYLTDVSADSRPFSVEQHRLAAEYFRESADVVSEIRHSIAAGDLELACERLTEVAPELATSARWHTLADLVYRYERASRGELPANLARYLAQAQVAVGHARKAVATVVRALKQPGLSEQEIVGLHITSSYAHRSWGAMDEALREAEEALAHAESLKPAQRVKALRVIGQIHASELRLELAGRFFSDAASLAETGELPRPRAMTMLDLSAYELICGRFGEAERLARAASELAEELEYVDARLFARNNLAAALHHSGEFSSALDVSEEVLEDARRHGHHRLETLAWLGRGDLQSDLQSADSAAQCYRRGLAMARDLDDPDLVAHALRSLAAHYRASGDLAASRRVLDDPEAAEPRVDKHSIVLRAIEDAALRSAEGNHAMAIKGLRSAVETLRTSGALVSLAMAQLNLAQALFKAEGVSAAVPVLDELAATLDAVGSQQFLIAPALRMPRMWGALETAGRADLRIAITEPDLRPHTSPQLRGLPPTARPGDPHPKLLTPREREVVIALCEGLTRDEIADRMGLSRSTIDKTISSTYASTGFRHAYQLVVWAIRCGLYDPTEPPPPQTETHV